MYCRVLVATISSRKKSSLGMLGEKKRGGGGEDLKQNSLGMNANVIAKIMSLVISQIILF